MIPTYSGQAVKDRNAVLDRNRDELAALGDLEEACLQDLWDGMVPGADPDAFIDALEADGSKAQTFLILDLVDGRQERINAQARAYAEA